jgi:hypothetical protein
MFHTTGERQDEPIEMPATCAHITYAPQPAAVADVTWLLPDDQGSSQQTPTMRTLAWRMVS